MQAMDAQVDRGAFADFDDLLLDLFLDFGHHLFDTGRVDATVGHQLMERQTCDFAAHGVETAQDNGFGRVVHDDFDAGCGFQRTDVAPFAADDAALDLVAFDVEYRHGVFDRRLGRHALDRRYDDALGLFGGGHLRLFDGLVYVAGGFGLGLGLHVFDQDVLGLLRAQARNLLQTDVLLAHHLIDLLFLVFEDLQLVLHLLLQPVVFAEFVLQIALLVLQVVLDLLGPLFALRDFLVAFVDLPVVFALKLYELLFACRIRSF